MLSEYSTKELTEELVKREGVSAVFVEPNEFRNFDVNGPAIVIINVD